MIKDFKANYKTLLPAVVGAGVVLYEAISGQGVTASQQTIITNDSIAVVGFVITFGGILYNHFKKKPTVTPIGMNSPVPTTTTTVNPTSTDGGTK